MFENNAFRTFMLIGSIILMGITVGGFFAAPLVEADATTKSSYKTVMGAEVGVDTTHPNHLTLYEALVFGIEGKSRGTVRFY